MRILWVPHAPLGVGRSRAEHLMETLAKRHEVYALSFNVYGGWGASNMYQTCCDTDRGRIQQAMKKSR